MRTVTLLAGGAGGAKLAKGINELENIKLNIIGNIGDDEEFHGLWVSPDIDSVTYMLSGRINRAQGWGVKDEGRRALDTLEELGSDVWMHLGDRDIGLHVYRTNQLKNGVRLSEITKFVAEKFKIKANIIVPTDDRVQTIVRTGSGWLRFQEYFVREKATPRVIDVAYQGSELAEANEEAITALLDSDLIVIGPSNPFLSIGPIISLQKILEALKNSRATKVAVSPIIGGKAIKGPLAGMMTSLGYECSVCGFAKYYNGFIDVAVIDEKDAALKPQVDGIMSCVAMNTIMDNEEQKIRFAHQLIEKFLG